MLQRVQQMGLCIDWIWDLQQCIAYHEAEGFGSCEPARFSRVKATKALDTISGERGRGVSMRLDAPKGRMTEGDAGRLWIRRQMLGLLEAIGAVARCVRIKKRSLWWL